MELDPAHGSKFQPMKLIREILVYAAIAVALAYAARQLEGVNVGKIVSDAESFLKLFDRPQDPAP